MKLFILTAFAVVGLAVPMSAQPTVTFSEVNINSLSTVLDPAADLLRNDTGAAVQLGPITGSRAGGFSNIGAPGVIVKNVTDAVLASASLATGTLKAKSSLALGANTFASPLGFVLPVGVRNGAASASAVFADSFRTYTGSLPFLWTNGTTATFHFNVTGQFTITGTVPDPATSSPPKPIDLVYAQLVVRVYKPGTIDLIKQVKEFDFSRPFSEFIALNNQINANQITVDYWYFGQVLADFNPPIDPSKILALPADVQFTFTPGGDFDWVATLDTNAHIDASLQNVGATLDFSNSLVSSYDGPPGTTTYSGSGVFPSTLPLGQAPANPFTGTGTPGQSNCQGKTTSALAKQYGGLAKAAAALGAPSVEALQNSIASFCGI